LNGAAVAQEILRRAAQGAAEHRGEHRAPALRPVPAFSATEVMP
jgi:hypothetical protein